MQGTKQAGAFLLLAAPLLAACQSLGGAHDARSGAVAPTLAEYGALQIALGRQALDDGRYGAAVGAFRNARQVPQWDAAACNGLAIAYSRIGRPDLAQRYFTQAIALAPEEPRYQANLERFRQAMAAARDARDRAAMAALDRNEDIRRSPAAALPPGIHIATGRTLTGGITAASPAPRLVRLSAGEVRIGGAQAVGKPAQGPATYPVRVSLGPREILLTHAPAPAASPALRAARLAARSPSSRVRVAYPVRVELQAAR